MTLLQRILARLSKRTPTHTTQTTTAPTEPVRVIIGEILDTRDWTQWSPGWAFEGTRIQFNGPGHSTLTSPPLPIPASRRVTVAATMACDKWGPYEARGSIGLSCRNGQGSTYGGPSSATINSGTASVTLDFPESAVDYQITLAAYTGNEGGTDDTRLLVPRFVNLAAG